MRSSVFDLGILGPHGRKQIYRYVLAAAEGEARGRASRLEWEETS